MVYRIILLTLFLGAFSSFAHANFSLITGIDLQEAYDDNIYLDPDNEEDDFITTVAPNVNLQWDSSRLFVSLNGSIAMVKYLDHTDDDRIGANAAQSSEFSALATLYRELLFLKVTDTYERVPIDNAGPGGEGNQNVNLTNSNILRVNPYLQFNMMKNTILNLGYTYENYWYSSNDGDNANNHLFSSSLTKELSPRLSVSLSGDYALYRPKSNDGADSDLGNYKYDQEKVYLTLEYQMSDRLHLTGEYGHSWFNYDERSDVDSPLWLAKADYDITSNYKVGIEYSKDYTVSVDEGPYDSDSIKADLSYDGRFSIALSLFYAKDDYVEIDRSDDNKGGEISGDLPFNDKVGITGLFNYTHYDESGIYQQKYDRYSTRFTTYYLTRLGRISAGYTYNRNDSDVNTDEYTNNIFFLSASLTF